MINTMFAHPPKLDLEPTSYFRATLKAHDWIKKDLKDVLTSEQPEDTETTIQQIHQSLNSIEKMLFGSVTEFEATIRGCCWYTEYLENRLKPTSGCIVH